MNEHWHEDLIDKCGFKVAERIDDIRRMGVARRDALQRVTERQKGVTSPTAGNLTGKPIQVVSPEKKPRGSVSSSASSSASSPTGSVKTTEKVGFSFFISGRRSLSLLFWGNVRH